MSTSVAIPQISHPNSSQYAIANAHWHWGEYSMPYCVAGDKTSPAIVLIHGFGGCIGHWRNNVEALAEKHRVYVIDLLGFGAAPKPKLSYSFELWGQQIVDFCDEVLGSEVTSDNTVALVGNSIGAIVAMQAAVMAPGRTRSLVAINCSLRLLHERRRDRISIIQRWGTPLVQGILNFRPVGHFFFNQVAKRRSLRNILKQAYYRHETITDELLDLLLKPAADEGAADVFISFISYSQGPLPEDLLPQLTCPAYFIWGEEDPWEPLDMGRSLGNYPAVQEFATIPQAGHCPMDEAWKEVNETLLGWSL